MFRRTLVGLLTALLVALPWTSTAGGSGADRPRPPVVDLTSWQSPIRDQGKRGSCTYFATVGALEAAYRRAGHKVDLSVEHLIWLRNTTALRAEGKTTVGI